MNIANKYDIRIYEDERAIQDTVIRLSQQYPRAKVDALKIPFDNEGNLLRDGDIRNRTWDYAARKWITTNKFKVERDNEQFVDAIRFIEVAAFGSRKGRINFEHPDGRKVYMSFKHFEEIADKLVRGWLIARFKYNRYYGAYGIECLEVLV